MMTDGVNVDVGGGAVGLPLLLMAWKNADGQQLVVKVEIERRQTCLALISVVVVVA